MLILAFESFCVGEFQFINKQIFSNKDIIKCDDSEEDKNELYRQIDLCDGFVLQGGLYSSKYEIEKNPNSGSSSSSSSSFSSNYPSYDANDYIRDYDEFLKLKHDGKI